MTDAPMTNSGMTASDAAGKIICAMQGKKVLLIGDIMLDCYVDGIVARISPEAPVPILHSSHTHQIAGGAANVAHNLANMGLSVTLIGLLGDDGAATQLCQQLDRIPQLQRDLLTLADRPTTRKTRFRAQGQQILRVDEEQSVPISKSDALLLLEKIHHHLAQSPDILVLSDYAKGCLSDAVVAETIQAAKGKGIAVIADPKCVNFKKYQQSQLLTPNLAELCAATGQTLRQIPDIEKAARAQIQQANLDAMLVTLGEQGMLYVGSGDALHLPATMREVFDVSGAGDTVVGVMAAALAAGSDWRMAMDLANRAAGIVIGKSGTATLTPGELLGSFPSTATIYSSNQLAPLLDLQAGWKATDLQVGFTNGCFDLLHPGHLDMLKRAADTCNRLIVGMNSDRSTAALKGAGRPLQSQDIRAAALSHLPFVDAVIVFDDDTPAALIDALLPDRLIKGGDYRAEDVVGFDTITQHGGIVEIIPLLAGHSTTRLVTD